MASSLTALGLDIPVLAAPMAGGPSTPALVMAAARAGGLGFLAGGYKTAAALAGQITEVRSTGVPFGVNLFVPNPVPVDPEAFHRYAREIAPDAEPYGVDVLGAAIVEDDDHWQDKLDLLLSTPVPVVSFTFGIPASTVIAALRTAGTVVVQTVTSPQEARQASEAGADMLAVQSSAAGGHSATLTPGRIPPPTPLTDLLRQVRHAVPTPLIAAGGLATPDAVAAALQTDATAVMVGTALLRAEEAGTSHPHKKALADPSRRTTTVTRAFTGRPARSLTNTFTDHHTATAPPGYPAVHHLTSPLRKAATAAGDPELINLWAGTGHRRTTAEPTARILRRLTS
ncbi:nitronate monooxygenase [Sphaerisporangium rubeum]|uniref:Propionate 3-nitronate monooxygenase n=1 Tax=Sphaerisporangium rubeum TaxID=321317 RepID=A0A7X0IFQ0_9ACTN|nr:nitronate monooxygenase [Sphaerisporangium rubeum]MBB6473724.1 NAD(P)H-dependent flavin oxidoreductase YrpB (nitropropane dioxygenase family) [Sphaerisporangium rubeum]